MKISRTSLILYSALGVVVIGAAVYFSLYPERVKHLYPSRASTTANANTSTPRVNQNISYTTNVSVPTEIKGDTPASGTLTVAGTTLSVSSVQRGDSYIDVQAGEGKTLMVVFIDSVPSTQVAAVVNTISSDIHLNYTGGSVTPRRTKVASDQLKNDRGYLIFEIPDGAKGLSLVNGTGPTAARLSLP